MMARLVFRPAAALVGSRADLTRPRNQRKGTRMRFLEPDQIVPALQIDQFLSLPLVRLNIRRSDRLLTVFSRNLVFASDNV